jgi:methoxymalonate biosynthesis acyl carrier protein
MTADDKLVDFIRSDLARGKLGGNLTEMDDLIDAEIMDSLGIMKLILFLEKNYSINISDEDLTLENFSTIRSIHSLVGRKIEGCDK